MARKSKPAATTEQLPLQAPEALDELLATATDLAKRIATLPLDTRVVALNKVRMALHEASPFRDQPVDLVLWVRSGTVDPNDYNPNRVAPPEMRLLALSIEEDGFTQPIVTAPQGAANDVDGIGDSETVDGFHRGRVGKEVPAVREKVHGYLPITRIRGSRSGRPDRIASTIRHNRARGVHQVNSMSEVVRILHVAGWPEEKIQEALGMEADEVRRLKQTTGLAALFADREFSEAWTPDDGRAKTFKEPIR